MRPLVSLHRLFSTSERSRLGALVVLTIIVSFFEVLGVGVLFPYVAVLQDPAQVARIEYLAILNRWLGLGSDRAFIVVMSISLLALICIKALATLALANLQLRFVNRMQTQFGRRLLEKYLGGPYAFFLSANTANLIGNLTTSLGQLCGGVIQSSLFLAAELVSFLGLAIFLVWLSPVFSLIAFLFMVALGITFVGVIRRKVTGYAKENDVRWKAMIRAINESFGAAKEIQVLGRMQYFIDAYAQQSQAYVLANRHFSVLSQLPRAALEVSAVAMLVAFAVVVIASGQPQADVFPILAVFAAATVRIVPSVNRIIQSWNAISFNRPAIEIVAGSLASGKLAASGESKNPSSERGRSFRHGFHLSVRSFAYGDNPHFQLQDIELTIQRGEKVAIVGRSGAGKSTLMDILLGLFPEFDGDLVVDGVSCRGDVEGWQRGLGYIPQSVYLRDDSIARNVAFGIADGEIDPAAVMRAVTLAGLADVVKNQASGLDTVVGDRGIRLSGGERQRIGIARALYHDPALLILDEATSALDGQVERQVVDSILALSPTKTVIIIAHRLSSVKLCDRVYLMGGGRIIDVGSFDEIAERHPDFVNPQATINPKARWDVEPSLGSGSRSNGEMV